LLAAVTLTRRRSPTPAGSQNIHHEDRAVENFIDQVVEDYMTRNVRTIRRDLTLRELDGLFEKDDFNTYPVEENGQVVGLVSKFDHLACFVFTPAHMMPRYDDLMRRTVADIMISEFVYVAPDTRLTRVLQLMVDHRIRSLPVIDSGQRLAGIISREDVMRALRRCTGQKPQHTR
jgi:CBS domain-containing protein